MPPDAPSVPDPCPDRPATEAEEDLGFRRRPMVDWFSPSELVKTGLHAVVSGFLGSFVDRRELQAALEPASVPSFEADPGTEELWFDYVADLGSGWNPTYSIALLLAREGLSLRREEAVHETRRGRFLVMGGDEVYPRASRQGYQDRLVGPYRAALPCVAEGEPPRLFAIPGNHDWYDGLSSFLRIFGQDRWIGGWRTGQGRSYFAVELPHRCWLWGIDIRLGADIDRPQLDYFHRVAEEHAVDGHGVILCTAKPGWVYGEADARKLRDNLAFFEKRVIRAHGARLLATLAGDLHHYARYEEADSGRPWIVAGGGGATTSPTHPLPDRVRVPSASDPERETAADLAATFPSRERSRRMTWGALALPFRSPRFAAAMGVIYLVLAWALRSGSLPSGDLLQLWAGVPISVAGAAELMGAAAAVALAQPAVALLLAGFLAGTLFFTGPGSWYAGVAHGLGHLVLMVLLSWLLVLLNVGPLGIPLASGWLPVVLGAEILVVGGVLAAFSVGAYLVAVHRTLGLHANEVMASQRVQDYKSFLRCRVGPEGVTIYPVGVTRVPRRWRLDRQADAADPWFRPVEALEARLVDGPVEIPFGPRGEGVGSSRTPGGR